ncbi:GTPase activator [Theileria orientalis]|uniref:GTPase activator n=1 Tax=Theileria orientalis TaxID=68886 RepID=A0A976M8T1_THEOR|nr:GTPase activator [Theileria orientalis]
MDEKDVEIIAKSDELSPTQTTKRSSSAERRRKGLFPFKKVESESDSSWFDIFGFGNFNVLNTNLTYGLTLALPQCDCKRLYSRPITFNVEQAIKDNPRFKSMPKQVKGERCKRFHHWWLKCCQSAVLKKQGIYWNVIQLLGTKVKINDQTVMVSEIVLGKRVTLAIDLDIKRTYPSLRFFNRYGRSMLRRILLAYSFFDTEVGYVQGLNFIVANLLWHSSEEQAFWALISMMYLYDMRCMFLPGLPGVFKRCEILEHCMVRHIPRLHNHLKFVGVHIPMIASDWFMTLCANSVPIRALARLWDSFFSEGWVAIFRFIIFRLKQFEDYLVTMSDIADIMKVIKYGNASLTERWNLIELIPGFGGTSRRKSQLINAAYSTNVENLTNDPNKVEKDCDWVEIVEESLRFDIEPSFIETLELTNSEVMYFDLPHYPGDYDFRTETLKSYESSEKSFPQSDEEAFSSPIDRSPEYGPADMRLSVSNTLDIPSITTNTNTDANTGANTSTNTGTVNTCTENTTSTITINSASTNNTDTGTTGTNSGDNKTGNTDANEGGGTSENTGRSRNVVDDCENMIVDDISNIVVDNGGLVIEDLSGQKSVETPIFESSLKILRDNSLGDIANRLQQLSDSFKSQLEALGVSRAYHLHLKALHDEL